jgi:hypothetical protein
MVGLLLFTPAELMLQHLNFTRINAAAHSFRELSHHLEALA